MSFVQTTAQRDLVDLTNFCFQTGSMGRLKVLRTDVVCPGDSYQADVVGAFRLSPLRRGLTLDCHLDIFTFYVPMRHIYGDTWMDMIKAGIPKTGTAITLPTDQPAAAGDSYVTTDFLGFCASDKSPIPKFYYQSYLQIYNNYFKIPFADDVTTTLAALPEHDKRDGFIASKLDSLWTKPLNPNITTSSFVKPDATLGVDLMALNAAYGTLSTQQEREHFMSRYRDVISDLGGSTPYDADNRPVLVMRTESWASGYDVDGTSIDSLGQFSGRVQQPMHHSVPRYYVPEHGVMMTLVLPRFPVVHMLEQHWFVGKGTLGYADIANDPALIGNMKPVDVPIGTIFQGQTGYTFKMAPGQQFRYQNASVDRRYSKLQGFPFLSNIPKSDDAAAMTVDGDYDACFQTNQLGDWNCQVKFNVSVLRRIPDVRQSLLTNQ